MSVWNPDNIRDVAESVGVVQIPDDVLQALSSDVEYRLSQVLEEALGFMRHARRNLLTTQDVAQALRVLQVEPLYGYDSTRPLRFGEASLGPGQPLFYVEDEEVDFEKLINAPLPKVPREIAYTAHWLAVEGVQPSIPQNPTAADARAQELMPKGAGAHPQLAALSGAAPGTGPDGATLRPLVKHVLSKELQLYFERVCAGMFDGADADDAEAGDEADGGGLRGAARTSVARDPGLQQLVPYFVQFVAEKVTHGLGRLGVLRRALDLAAALLENGTLFLDPYVASLVPPVLTCLIAPRLGGAAAGPATAAAAPPLAHYPVRATAAALLGRVAAQYAASSRTLKPRLARTCLKHFLDPRRPFAVHYGALLGLRAVSGREGIRSLVLPNLKEYGKLLQEGLDAGPPGDKDAEMALGAVIGSLRGLEDEGGPLINGYASGDTLDHRAKLEGKVGPLLANRILREESPQLVQAVLEA